MATNEEYVCCMEITEVVEKLKELGDPNLVCITSHPGFSPVCLNTWVLQTYYYQYRQDYGTTELPPSIPNEVSLFDLY